MESRLLFLSLAVLCGSVFAAPEGWTTEEPPGRALYQAACASCHGADGTGAPQSLTGLQQPLPDFTDCSFATREPDADWMAVSHDGGPARAFARTMPAFGDELSEDDLSAVLTYVRGFCRDKAWPRGELNLPRALVTEKAFPEDEAVFSSAAAAEGRGGVSNKLIYEKRFGARNQVELVFPFSWEEGADPRQPGHWTGGVGDLAVAFKRAVYHSLERGSIFSVVGEVVVPTGDQDLGFGKGTTVFEPFVAFGQILPRDSFLQFQGGFEIPLEGTEEAFWRLAVGKSFNEGRFGRTWSPMLEVLGARELAGGEKIVWDVVPELQVTLSTRQHIMANVGVRIPWTDSGARDTEVMFYVLWDWFDGGLFDGW